MKGRVVVSLSTLDGVVGVGECKGSGCCCSALTEQGHGSEGLWFVACSVNLGGWNISLYLVAYVGRRCCIGIDSGLRRFMKDLGAGFSIRRFW